MEVLTVSSLTKRYGEKTVVNGISFGVMQGDILGFLGPNGAGKSTTIRMITGIEKKDSGSISLCGKEMRADDREIKRRIGIVPQEIAVYEDLSAYDNVRFFCSLYGYKGKELQERIKEALEFTGLWERRRDRPGKFSGGMKRRLNIACSIAHSPELLIMDEPTVGIDPQSRNYIMEAIKTLNQRGTTVIYVSHYMEEVELLCNCIILADNGEILEDLEKEKLKKKYAGEGLNSLEDIFLHITGRKLRDSEE